MTAARARPLTCSRASGERRLLQRTHNRSLRGAVVIAVTVMSVAFAPVSAFAWGAAAHRYIMGRAIDLLPPEMRPFFKDHRDEVVLRVNDPDLWRTAGFDEDANHFVDFGVSEFGPYPFTALPRDFDAAIEKFGMPALKRLGLLPWREAEEFGNLRRAFEGLARGSQYASTDTVLYASVAAHYIQDAYQPFHATNNYDGQLTNQNGVHARFETALFERFESRLTINPASSSPTAHPRDAAFDTLLASHQLVLQVLEADKEAASGKEAYDDDYFEKFFAKVRPVLEQRLGGAITATASILWGAWEQAGRPLLKNDTPRAAEKVRRSNAR
jgi:hypothetical protein